MNFSVPEKVILQNCLRNVRTEGLSCGQLEKIKTASKLVRRQTYGQTYRQTDRKTDKVDMQIVMRQKRQARRTFGP